MIRVSGALTRDSRTALDRRRSTVAFRARDCEFWTDGSVTMGDAFSAYVAWLVLDGKVMLENVTLGNRSEAGKDVQQAFEAYVAKLIMEE
jgi:hypothetical protein